MLREHRSVVPLRDRGLGLYMNLGIKRAPGEMIDFFNPDGLYPAGGPASVLDGFHRHPQAETISCAAELFDDSFPLNRFSESRDPDLGSHTALIGGAIPNARFYQSHIFRRISVFPTSFSRVADREFLCRDLMANLSRAQIPDLVSCYRRYPGSLTLASGANEDTAFQPKLIQLADEPRKPATMRSIQIVLPKTSVGSRANIPSANCDFGGLFVHGIRGQHRRPPCSVTHPIDRDAVVIDAGVLCEELFLGALAGTSEVVGLSYE